MASTHQIDAAGGAATRAWMLVFGILTLALATGALMLPVISFAPRGGLVGWLLLLAGLTELALGWARRSDSVGKAALGSGIVTIIAGTYFVLDPLVDFILSINIVTVWLIVRGAWVLLTGLEAQNHRITPWLGLSGGTSIILAVALLAGLPVSAVVIVLFGPTTEIISTFAIILAVNFLISGIAHVALALVESRNANIR